MKEQIEQMIAELRADMNVRISKDELPNMAYQLGIEKGITKLQLLSLQLELGITSELTKGIEQ